MQFTEIQLLSRCPVFQGISETEASNLLKKIHFQIKNYDKDQIVVNRGDTVNHLFIVLQGSVRGEMIDFSGKTIKIEDVEAPRPLAAAFMFGSDNKFPVTVTSNEKVKILAIPVGEFLKILQLNEKVLKNYLNNMSTRAQFLTQKLQLLSFKTIKQKMAHFLLNRAGDRYHSVEIMHTQQQLSDLFGVTRPSLARVLADMQAEKLIRIEKRTVTILDRSKLNQLIIHV